MRRGKVFKPRAFPRPARRRRGLGRSASSLSGRSSWGALGITAGQRALAVLVLLLVTLVWGLTFVILKVLSQELDPYITVFVRFLIASVVSAIPFVLRARRMDWGVVGAGIVLGAFLWTGYLFQNVGIQYTSASKSAFLTGLSVAMVPLVAALVLRRSPVLTSWVGACLAGAGLALLTLDLKGPLSFNRGDALTLVGALAFAVYIVMVSVYSRNGSVGALVFVQFVFVTVASLVVLLIQRKPLFPAESPVEGLSALLHLQYGIRMKGLLRLQQLVLGPFTSTVWASLLYLGLLGTGFAVYAQNAAQRYTTPTQAAVVLTMEPVFAGVFSFFLLFEAWSPQALVGAGLIVAGMILAGLEPVESVRGRGR